MQCNMYRKCGVFPVERLAAKALSAYPFSLDADHVSYVLNLTFAKASRAGPTTAFLHSKKTGQINY